MSEPNRAVAKKASAAELPVFVNEENRGEADGDLRPSAAALGYVRAALLLAHTGPPAH
jgi:hypothetical protein